MLHHAHLEIHQRDREGIDILDLKGRLILGGGEVALRDFVQSLFDGGNRRLVLNLHGVSEIDTSGMGVLLLLAEQYIGAGEKMVLFNLARTHGKVYEMARLESAVEIYRDELDAVNSFFPDRKVIRYDILDYVETHVLHEDPKPKT
jgi:anti-sigma B factor antagonist